MVDALEAEREAAKRRAVPDGPAFSCEPGDEKVEAEPAALAQRTVDEPAP
jgi:hypothetical protein